MKQKGKRQKFVLWKVDKDCFVPQGGTRNDGACKIVCRWDSSDRNKCFFKNGFLTASENFGNKCHFKHQTVSKNKKYTLAVRRQTENGANFNPAGSANKACVAGARQG